MWISKSIRIYAPSWASLPLITCPAHPHPTPLVHHRAPSWFPCVLQLLQEHTITWSRRLRWLGALGNHWQWKLDNSNFSCPKQLWAVHLVNNYLQNSLQLLIAANLFKQLHILNRFPKNVFFYVSYIWLLNQLSWWTHQVTNYSEKYIIF